MTVVIKVRNISPSGTAELAVQASAALQMQGIGVEVIVEQGSRSERVEPTVHHQRLQNLGILVRFMESGSTSHWRTAASELAGLTDGAEALLNFNPLITSVMPVLLAQLDTKVRSDFLLATSDLSWADPLRRFRAQRSIPLLRRLLALRLEAVAKTLATSPVGFTAVSKTVAKATSKALNLDPNKVAVVYPGFDLSRFSTGPPSNAGATKRILFVGRLSWEKGADLLPSILAMVLSQGVDASLDIVGDGPLRGDLTKEVEELGLEGVVRFLGHREDVADRLAQASVFLAPSRHEGLAGFATLEAMASGVVCVTSNIDAVTEVLAAGASAAVASEPTPLSYAQELLALFRDPDEASEIAHRARSFVRSQFALGPYGQRLRSRIQDLPEPAYSAPERTKLRLLACQRPPAAAL